MTYGATVASIFITPIARSKCKCQISESHITAKGQCLQVGEGNVLHQSIATPLSGELLQGSKQGQGCEGIKTRASIRL